MIYKDIEIVKEFKENGFAGLLLKYDKDLVQTNKMIERSLENVLKELEIKDKTIDLMAEYLADIDFDECCAEIPEPCLNCSWEDYEPHTQCIKEYFRKKAQNE